MRRIAVEVSAARIEGGKIEDTIGSEAPAHKGAVTDMAIPLYDLTVVNFLQTLGAVAGFLDKGLAHCTEGNVESGTLVESRLYEDMMPLSFQIVSVVHHSLGAIEGVKAGVFTPPMEAGPSDYAGLQKLVADTRQALQQLSPAEVNALEGRDVAFQLRGRSIPFIAEGFLLSFSIPNFYFHATTAYDILRNKGVKLGKRDFLGQLRIKT